MSQYKKTILTQAGIDLAKRANAGTTKFKITRVVTSADDLSEKSIEELEKITEIPNIMQVGKITDAEEVESDNSVIGVGLRFTNRGLTNGYKIRIIGLYVQEEGQTDDFLYALTTAIEPEFMPDFNDSVLYRFNMQMYVVVGRTQSVNVVISDDTVVSIKKFNQLKQDNDRALKELNDHKADVSDVDQKLKAIDFGKIGIKEHYLNPSTNVAQRTIFPVKQSDGNWIFDRAADDATAETAKKALEQVLQNGKTLNHLSEQFNTKADKDDVDKALKSIDFGKIAFRKQYTNDLNGSKSYKTWSANKQTDGTWLIDLSNDDCTAANASEALSNSRSNEGKINDLRSSKLNFINASEGYDLLSADGTWGIIEFNNVQDIKNLPPLSNKTWMYALKLVKDDFGSVIVFSQDNTIYQNVRNGTSWDGWSRVLRSDDLTNLQNQITDRATNSTVNVAAPLFRRITSSNTWQDILGVANGNQILESIRDESSGGNTLGNFSSAVAFGGGDTKGVLNVAYTDHLARIIGGNGDHPQWHEDIAWKSDIQNLLNMLNQQSQQIQSLTTQLNNAKNEIDYIKQNYVEGKRFASNQEDQAKAWESQNSQRVAFISD